MAVGRWLTEAELAALSYMPISVVLVLLPDGGIATIPEFMPNEQMPDLPALLRYIADNMEPVKGG